MISLKTESKQKMWKPKTHYNWCISLAVPLQSHKIGSIFIWNWKSGRNPLDKYIILTTWPKESTP